ncbi:hypothetical protein ElyMa_005970800 [Elysia marginata]|uniref:Uncharacterized protein n=1 Tax=Elysia marginata TaxID=1093978 RepID=A0AAV4GCW9_9GAST|nr:hypothetical protein ElyMa_005970800 [Elysia marginata]
MSRAPAGHWSAKDTVSWSGPDLLPVLLPARSLDARLLQPLQGPGAPAAPTNLHAPRQCAGWRRARAPSSGKHVFNLSPPAFSDDAHVHCTSATYSKSAEKY